MIKHILILFAVLIIIIFILLFFYHKQIQEMKMEMKEIQSNMTSIHSYLDADMSHHVQQAHSTKSPILDFFPSMSIPPSNHTPRTPSFHEYMNDPHEEEEEDEHEEDEQEYDEDVSIEEDDGESYDGGDEEEETIPIAKKPQVIDLEDEDEDDHTQDLIPNSAYTSQTDSEVSHKDDLISFSSSEDEDDEVPIVHRSQVDTTTTHQESVDDSLQSMKTIQLNPISVESSSTTTVQEPIQETTSETSAITQEISVTTTSETPATTTLDTTSITTLETTATTTQETVATTTIETSAIPQEAIETKDEDQKVIQIEMSEKSAGKRQASMIPDENPEDFETGHIVQSVHDKKFYQVKENRKKEKHWVKVKNVSS